MNSNLVNRQELCDRKSSKLNQISIEIGVVLPFQELKKVVPGHDFSRKHPQKSIFRGPGLENLKNTNSSSYPP